MLSPHYQKRKGLFWEGHISNIPVTVINVPYSNLMSFSERIKSFIQFAFFASFLMLRYRADLVFASSTPLTIAIPGILAKQLKRIPMVFEVRDLWPELPIAVGALRNSQAKTLALTLERLAYRSSIRIVALSSGMKEGIHKRGIPLEKIDVIPNSCDTDQFDIPPSEGLEIRHRLGISNDAPLVVYTGTMGLINGVGFLVDLAAEAARLAPEMKFLIVGTGYERDKIIQKAKRREVLHKNLWIWEPVPKFEIPKILAAATIATSLFVSLKPMWNNSANKFFDALAAGKPVAINYRGWQEELIRESGAGVVLPASNRIRAAQLLVDFVYDSERLSKGANAARELAYTKFQRDTLADELEKVFEKCLNG
jgi:glycosyltransferase involved in cell wall biosynthesis